MINIMPLFVLLSGLSVPVIAADTSSCYNIADKDHRVACLAKAHNDSGRCYAIKDQQLRSQCQAETRK